MKRINSRKNRQKLQGSVFRLATLIATIAILGLACKKDDSTSATGLTPFEISIPPGFPGMDIPEDNRPYVERLELGRRLYYDPILSNNGLSCSSCHWQKKGFTSPSQGMPILPHVNMAWRNVFMWDGREQGSLEDVMQFEVEEFFHTDISKLNKHPDYPELFAEAYDVQTISSRDVARALAQFTRIQISSDSKFDRVQRSLAQFTEDEARGFAIFNSEKGSCYHCHTPPMFADNNLHNIGLDSTFHQSKDWGYFNVTGDSIDLGRMRTPSLRNVALRESFMHDGRFSILEEVVQHYNEGVKRSPSLDPTMIKGGYNVKLNLSATELSQLVAFLHTLTDSTYITNNALSKP